MGLFEKSDFLNNPIECFYFDSTINKVPVKPHFHYYMEILLMKKGHVTISDNNKDFILGEGEMVLFHPNGIHAIYPYRNEHIVFEGFKVDINRMNLTTGYSPKLRSIYKSIEQKNISCRYPKDFVKEINAEKLFDRCLSESNNRNYGYDVIVKTQIYSLLIEILRYHMANGFSIDSETYADDGRYDIFRITDYIDSRLNENLKITDIASACGMSYSYFAKKFQTVYGKNCKEYIEEMRVYKAEELLLFTDFDLTYIANECGYSDCSHLINSFKKYKNTTPKQFRNLHSNKH